MGTVAVNAMPGVPMRCAIWIVLVLTCASACATPDPPAVSSVRFLPYKAEEHGKFIEFTLDRPLGRKEIYNYELELATKGGRHITCGGRLENAFGNNDTPLAQVLRQNLFVACASGRSRRYEWETVDAHVGPGMVQSVTVALGNRDSRKFDVGRWTFGPL